MLLSKGMSLEVERPRKMAAKLLKSLERPDRLVRMR